jgi:hypothetical protein
MAGGFRMVGAAVQPGVDAVPFLIQPPVDPLTAAVETKVNPIPIAIQPIVRALSEAIMALLNSITTLRWHIALVARRRGRHPHHHPAKTHSGHYQETDSLFHHLLLLKCPTSLTRRRGKGCELGL